MKVVVIVQARMSSNRLRGKVLMPLAGTPVLSWVIGRLQQCQKKDELVVATSQNDEDDAIVKIAQVNQAKVYRGPLNDVLTRFYGAAKEAQAEAVVRICSDCPWIDWQLVDDMIADFKLRHQSHSIDYLSNTLQRTYPRGLDCEIMTFKALERAHQHAIESYEREHVTPYLYLNSKMFKLHHYTGEMDLKDFRWTLDTSDDFDFMEAVLAASPKPDNIFIRTDQILEVLKSNPKLIQLNQHVHQKTLQDA